MALFSELDWLVFLAVAAVFLLGRDGGTLLRQVGRWYGRAVRLKRELMIELTRSAGLPEASGAGPTSLRALFLAPSGTAASESDPEASPAASPPRSESTVEGGAGR
jgi:hypothetical protein